MSAAMSAAMSNFAQRFDAQSHWRRHVRERIAELARLLQAHDLADDAAHDAFSMLAERLGGDKLVVAFVAEFSRGKSELINAVFFGDTGRRVLPATPGRTTMCPVELGFDAAAGPSVRLLPIATRKEAATLAELRQPARWTELAVDPARPDTLADAMAQVTRTANVSVNEAKKLGFWNDARPDDNPPRDAAGRVEVPAWRHALVNYPHPLLRQGLVVIDTPGLNAIGAEPELTLGLLPSAHATVFVLGADTGVTRSDLAVWRDHLGAASRSRFVVLNKIDALADPLLAPAEVASQVAAQCRASAAALDVPVARVYALSARQALAARVAAASAPSPASTSLPNAVDAGVAASGIVRFEQALAAELLPGRQAALAETVGGTLRRIETQALRQLGDERRQLAEQMLELRGLRGKSGSRVAQLLTRVDADAAAFEQCTARLQALHTVHGRLLKEALGGLASDGLRTELALLQKELDGSWLKLGARRAVSALCGRLRLRLNQAGEREQALREMLGAQFTRLNADFGFALALPLPADWGRHADELSTIESSYVHYLGLGQALRLAQPKAREHFVRLLVAKLRALFDAASDDIERANKAASGQLDAQLRDRRRGFRKRQQALQRIQTAAGELESRIADIEHQDHRLLGLRDRVAALAEAARRAAAADGHDDVPASQLPPVADATPADRANLAPAMPATDRGVQPADKLPERALAG